MRTVFCSCGLRLTAADEQQLFDLYRKHSDDTHADTHIADETIRAVIAASAHDDFKEPHSEQTTAKEYGA